MIDKFLFKGTIYLLKDINIARSALSDQHPYVLLNVDDTDCELSREFPTKVQQSNILCPPPGILYKEIDGDIDGFVNGYNMYLASKEVDNFISMMMCCLYKGINLILYVIDYSDDSVWINILVSYLYKTYGIKVGISANDKFDFDIRYIGFDVDRMFVNGHINIFEYMSLCPHMSAPTFDKDLVSRIREELEPFTAFGVDPLYTFNLVKSINPNIPARPALMFKEGLQC